MQLPLTLVAVIPRAPAAAQLASSVRNCETTFNISNTATRTSFQLLANMLLVYIDAYFYVMTFSLDYCSAARVSCFTSLLVQTYALIHHTSFISQHELVV